MELMPHQLAAIEQLGNGKILYGGVGTGKTATALGYYMKKEAPKNICVITTAKKRDSLEWEAEAAKFGIGDQEDGTVAGIIEVDSWNKIDMYTGYTDTFFIFDEQRLVGYGAWVKSFLKITRNPGNSWILLSATPGDTWLDYAPVFIANGFFKNITEFKWKHVLYEPHVKYPKVRAYLGETKLELLRNDILVEMPYLKHTKRYLNWWEVGLDKDKLELITKKRWNPYEDKPVKDSAELFRLMRRVANEDPSRYQAVLELHKVHPKLIVFYNFDYELEILRNLSSITTVGEMNGHRKDPIPDTDKWVYLVQYVAGAEAWNCTQTDAMLLYSMTYSYKNFIQAMGRIDRLDSPFTDLRYYILLTNLGIDPLIRKSLDRKEDFNERKFFKNNPKLFAEIGGFEGAQDEN